MPEAVVVHVLFEKLVVVFHDRGHDAPQGFFEFDAGVFSVRMLSGVVVGYVRGHALGDCFGNQSRDAVCIFPFFVAEKVVELVDDVGKPV